VSEPRRIRVLVTGATGFLGRNILLALRSRPQIEAIAACRDPAKLLPGFTGDVRPGDLLDASYRRAVVADVDVVCHAGTWGSFWGHAELERTRFFEPAVDLIEHSISAGVRRFLLSSTVAIAADPTGTPVDDFAPTRRTGFWPHLDRLIDLDDYMRGHSDRGTQMITMRLGHFIGAGNDNSMIGALTPRLRTRLVPWVSGGRTRVPLVADSDLGEAFALATTADGLREYESFNICGSEFPTMREVIGFVARSTGTRVPWFGVSPVAAHAFAWLMEKLHPLLPGRAPFLTRSLVHVAKDWICSTEHARVKLGYVPRKDWRTAASEALAELASHGYPWPALAQSTR
jgi:nucleoside-diphosphate-sugar epimerase